jgi:hypothetical protein
MDSVERLKRPSVEFAKNRGSVMDSDWLWVALALGIFIPAGMVPVAMARDACRWYRDHRRERREIVGRHL